MLRVLSIPLGLLILLAGVMVWSREDDPRPPDFVFINRGEINTLDPNGMSWLQDIRVGYALWEGLYALDPETLEAVPGAAGQVDISDDLTVYTFHIRPEAGWSNGDPVTAHDFVFAWRRMLEQPAYYTYLLHYIRGALEYETAIAQGRPAEWSTVGVEVLDDKTLRVTLNDPVAFFPDLCAFPPYFPLHEPSMRPFAQTGTDGKIRYRPEFTRPPHLVTNGAYHLDSWDFKRRLRLVANAYYWDRASVRSPIIDMISFEDAQAAFLKYESGAVDWLAHVSNEIAPELLDIGRADFHVFPGFGTYYYSINCQERLPDGRQNPFADVRVRQAFAMSLNKKPIVGTITRMHEPVATTYIPPGAFAGYEPMGGLLYDPDAARRLLADAGYPDGRGFPEFTLLFNTGGDHEYIAQYARSQWQTILGVQVNLEGVEVGTFRQRLNRKEYTMARASWIGDYNDPSTFTDKYLSTSDNNNAGWINPQYDRLCREAAAELDPQRRIKLLGQAEALLNTEAPIIPVFHYVNTYLMRPGVKGVPLHPRNMVVFKAVEVAE
jgi:oligopeptide transport system substrate-binding protein